MDGMPDFPRLFVVADPIDAAERRLAQELLRNQSEFLTLLLENIGDGVIAADIGGHFLVFNEAAERIFGPGGRRTWPNQLYLPDRTTRLMSEASPLAQALRGEAFDDLELFAQTSGDEAGRWLLFSGRPLCDNQGDLRGAVVICRDITRRHHDEDALRASEQRFRQLAEHAQELVYRLQTLSERLIEVQEAERRHLARELHDEIGQGLTALGLLLEPRPQLDESARTAMLSEAGRMLSSLIAQIRTLSLELRPTLLDDLGLLPALHWLFDRYTERTGVTVEFRESGIEGRFSSALETAAYRIVQEALTNVARYAAVNMVQVRVWATEEFLAVQVEDRGRGFACDGADVFARGGLSGMRERAQLLGGQFTLESAPGQGTFIGVELPLVADRLPQQADAS